jgi:hypothetical protein
LQPVPKASREICSAVSHAVAIKLAPQVAPHNASGVKRGVSLNIFNVCIREVSNLQK